MIASHWVGLTLPERKLQNTLKNKQLSIDEVCTKISAKQKKKNSDQET